MGNFLSNFAAGIATAAVIGLVAWRWPVIRAWHQRRQAERAAAAERSAADKAKRDRATRIEAAAAEGRVIEIGRSGSRPVRVDLSDGTSRFYFCGDLAAYKRALGNGEYPPLTTFHTNPPPAS